jgi:hypothetical protein
MFISVMNALPFWIGCPDSDVTRPVSVAPWASAPGTRNSTSAAAAVNRKTTRDEDVHFMFTSGRVDADGVMLPPFGCDEPLDFGCGPA